MALLNLDLIAKSFGATVALDGVSLAIESGQVLALVGENGSGKSTLMRIVSGAIIPESGSMVMDGQIFAPLSPIEAQRAGIAMIHQELAQCSHLTVGENIVLGREPRKFGLLDYSKIRQVSNSSLRQLGAGDIDPDRLVSSLPIDQRQIVELARAIASDSRVVILDEPTSSLGKSEVERLFEVIGMLRAAGKAIVYISHYLEEIQAISDRIAVLRDGELVAVASQMTNDEIVAHMVGRTVDDIYPKTTRTPGEILIHVDQLTGKVKPKDANLEVRRGEIVGIMGLNGSGRSELLRTIFGLDPVRNGSVTVEDYSLQGKPDDSWDHKLGMLSEDRKEEGLALALSIRENITLTKLEQFAHLGLIDDRAQTAEANRWIDRLRIKCAGPNQAIGSLSGGNQQKAAIARMLFHDVDVLLMDEPTRGIDIGSKEQIYELITELARTGKGILLVSSYLPELMGLCDRIHVMRNGTLGDSHPISELTPEKLMQEATF